jgi:membrane fusion protein (multidrug efflux system)
MFTEGGVVQAQQQLYQIDPAPYEAAEESAEAALDHAKAEFTSANAQGERYQALKYSNAISKADFDTAISNQGQARADIESAEAALHTAKINLVYTKVLAPISGRTGISTTEGALVTTNQTTSLVTIQQLDPIYVDIPQSTSLLLRFKREIASGQIKAVGDNQAQVTLTLEDGSSYDKPGSLQFAEVTVDQGTGSVILRAVFPNSSNLLLPGMFVTAHLEEGVSENAILIPQQCVTNDPQGNHTVLIVTSGGKVESRTIQTDRAIKNQWLVTTGLQAGDRVIVSGIQKAMPGATVHATEQASAPAVP